ncbi:MAG: low specificity L-threonine aldolase [Gemmatimonadaceae bacterium]|nr:low specificity L-threonine aldolase [Gemmatimonadaceae bacterium]
MHSSKRSFASDNWAGAHPEVMAALSVANIGHQVAYGDDTYTASAQARFREHFGESAEIHFVFNGTGANVLSLESGLLSHQAVITPVSAHINIDECGAPERYIGCKVQTVRTTDGKLTREMIEPLMHVVGNEHHSQPRALSITQSTEYGTVYSPDEIALLAEFAHRHDMFLHMDGARIANAAAALGVPLRAITTDVGVDVLSFGGTKNGVMFGEAVVFLNPVLAKGFKFRRKQGMQLASKMRFVAVQFEALLTDDLWLRSAKHANAMARLLESELCAITAVKITQPVQANGVFAIFPREHIAALQEKYSFFVWDESISECRLMCSFDTTEEDIRSFGAHIRSVFQA